MNDASPAKYSPARELAARENRASFIRLIIGSAKAETRVYWPRRLGFDGWSSRGDDDDDDDGALAQAAPFCVAIVCLTNFNELAIGVVLLGEDAAFNCGVVFDVGLTIVGTIVFLEGFGTVINSSLTTVIMPQCNELRFFEIRKYQQIQTRLFL